MEVFHTSFDSGLLCRATGDIIVRYPPPIVSEAQIDEIVDRIGAALAKVA